MGISDTQITDLVNTTLTHRKQKGKLIFISQDLQDYPLANEFLRREKRKIRGGPSITFTVQNGKATQAKQVRLFESDKIAIPKSTTTATVYWRRTKNDWGWEYREFLENQGSDVQIIDLIEGRYRLAMLDHVQHMENQAWGTPAQTDDLDVYGIPLWITKAVAGTTFANGFQFYGQNPNGWTSTSPGGVDRSTTDFKNFRNATVIYREISKNDLILKLRKMRNRTNFKSPIGVEDMRGRRGRRFRYYSSFDMVEELERLAELQNDNLGPDVAPMDGRMTIRSNPIVPVPIFDELTGAAGTTFADDGRVYQIDLDTIYPYYLSGDFMRETGPIRMGDSHNVFGMFLDSSWNIVCIDPRANGVASLSDEAGTVPST